MLIMVTGASGMLGRLFCEELVALGIKVFRQTRDICDLRDVLAFETLLTEVKPHAIIHCAAEVQPAHERVKSGITLYHNNSLIDLSVFSGALKLNVDKLIYISSSSIYSNSIDDQIPNTSILRGKLKPADAFYGLSKIAGTNLVTSIAGQTGFCWRTFVLPSLFGPFDKFEPDSSHLIPSIIMKGQRAIRDNLTFIEMLGDGSGVREIAYAPDIVKWLVFNLTSLSKFPLVLNIGSGKVLTVLEYYERVLDVLGWNLQIVPNFNFLNGVESVILDSSVAMEFGWCPKTSFEVGVKKTYSWFKENVNI